MQVLSDRLHRVCNGRMSEPSFVRQDPQQLRQMYQALVEQIPAVIYINGPGENAETLYVSPQTEEILGLPASGWFDESWTACVHPDDLEAMSQNYTRFLRSREDVGVDEYRFIRPDGQVIWLHDRVTIIRDETGAPTLVQGLMFDVTERRRTAEVLARIEDIGQRFTGLLLRGASLREILTTLAEIVDNPVMFEDSAHQLVGHARASVSNQDLVTRWESHSRSTDHDSSCLWQSVRIRDEDWGRLHVLAVNREPDEVDRIAVDRAASAIGLWLVTQREAGGLADAARAEVLADVWLGRGPSGREVLARFRSLGADLDRPVLVGFAVECHDLRDRLGAFRDTRTRRRTAERLLARVRTALADSGTQAVTAVVGDLCLGIAALAQSQAPRSVLGGIADHLADQEPDLTLGIGLSRPTSAEHLKRALTEATDAAAHGVGIQHAEDLGLRRLLGHLGDGPELSHFVESELGPLLEYDATHSRPLIPTLVAYLHHACSKSATARALHIERRTLYYRLEHIERLLDRPLEDPAGRLRLEVALQGLGILRT